MTGATYSPMAVMIWRAERGRALARSTRLACVIASLTGLGVAVTLGVLGVWP